MLISLSDASDMICPVNQQFKEQPFYCAGTSCMAWRTAHDGLGFCGMAGKPSRVVLTELVAGKGLLEGGAA